MQSKLLIIRKEKNITQEFFAKILGITAKQYGFKERGKTEFLMSEMFILSNYLRLPIEDVFIYTKHQNGVNTSKKESSTAGKQTLDSIE